MFGTRRVWRRQVAVNVSDPASHCHRRSRCSRVGAAERCMWPKSWRHTSGASTSIPARLLEYCYRIGRGTVFKRVGYLAERGGWPTPTLSRSAVLESPRASAESSRTDLPPVRLPNLFSVTLRRERHHVPYAPHDHPPRRRHAHGRAVTAATRALGRGWSRRPRAVSNGTEGRGVSRRSPLRQTIGAGCAWRLVKVAGAYNDCMESTEQAQAEARVRRAWVEYQAIHHDATVAVREASRCASDEIAAAYAAGLSVESLSEVLQRPISVIVHRLRSRVEGV